MRYTVAWLQSAQDELTQIWLESTDRREITDAANAVDQELSKDPERKGAAVSEGLRTLHIPPLRVLFAVSVPDRLVEVSRVRRDPPADSGDNGAVHPES